MPVRGDTGGGAVMRCAWLEQDTTTGRHDACDDVSTEYWAGQWYCARHFDLVQRELMTSDDVEAWLALQLPLSPFGDN